MITKFTKSILIAAIIIFGAMSNATAKTSKIIATQKYEINNSISSSDNYCGVSSQEIVVYLNSFGYHVAKMDGIPGTCEVLCRTIDNKSVVVHITEGQIIGHDEIII